MAQELQYKIICHCGLASQTISRPNLSNSPSGTTWSPQGLDMCHCKSCRKTTGLLCVSYMRIEAPSHTNGLIAYRSTQYVERFFCGTCGCHVFWRREDSEGDVAWAVATGVIEGRIDGSGVNELLLDRGAATLSEPQYARHINVTTTRDGGLSTYLPEIRGKKMDDMSGWGSPGDDVAYEVDTGEKNSLLAGCHCGNVSFHITRPNESSHVPKRPYSDLIHPFSSTPPDIVANPEGETWWIRPPQPDFSPQSRSQHKVAATRYLAGACACSSCRLTSGFEIQTWAFVPRSNIFFHISLPVTEKPSIDTTKAVAPLDFGTLPPGILKSYHSSSGVVREFCANCGATVFWHEEQGAEVVDVSAGLFDAVEGARAENWLDWWTGRVSFSEEASTMRSGEVTSRAEGLIESLERGMREIATRTG